MGSGFTAIIAEKPKAAEKIARALGGAVKCRLYGVPYWMIRRNGERIVVVSSAGHLFGVTTWKRGFPVYEYEWRPLWEYDKSASYLRKFYNTLKYILPRAARYVNACDYDIEGSLIGYMIIEAFGDTTRAWRMVFSSLSPAELRLSYRNLRPLDKEMVEAGKARHEMDWLWGINVSRALMQAVRRIAGKPIVLSAGRVQSPTLVEAVRRWREIKLAVPLPVFHLTVTLEKDGVVFRAYPHQWTPKTKMEAEEIARYLRSNPRMKITSTQKSTIKVRPPPAFNLGDLQAEAARLYKYSPLKTQKLAEDLYLDALISYPRTNSQKLPPTINYRSILDSLRRIGEYRILVDELLTETRGVLKPVQGRKDDPAHPAIYPTGEVPRGLDRDHARIYDLIVRRFLAAFSTAAVIDRTDVLMVDGEGRLYSTKGIVIIDEGWWRYYLFLKPKENRLPVLREDEIVDIIKVNYTTKWTAKKPALSRSSLLKWMEANEIGTEATRARIIEILFKRKYLESRKGATIVTDLGIMVADIIEELFPDLAKVELTRRFEQLIEKIRSRRYTRAFVIEETIKELNTLIEKYYEKLDSVERRLAIALGVLEPAVKCVICGREAVTREPVPLCKHHNDALHRIKANLPTIMERMGVDEDRALKLLASRRSDAGQWVVEVSRLLTETNP